MNLIMFVLATSMLLVFAMAVKLEPSRAGSDGLYLGRDQELSQVAAGVDEPWYLAEKEVPHTTKMAQTRTNTSTLASTLSKVMNGCSGGCR